MLPPDYSDLITSLLHDFFRHIKAFEDALKAEDTGFDTTDPRPSSPASGTHTPSGHRVRKVSALSDFAPVNLRVQRYINHTHTIMLRYSLSRPPVGNEPTPSLTDGRNGCSF